MALIQEVSILKHAMNVLAVDAGTEDPHHSVMDGVCDDYSSLWELFCHVYLLSQYHLKRKMDWPL